METETLAELGDFFDLLETGHMEPGDAVGVLEAETFAGGRGGDCFELLGVVAEDGDAGGRPSLRLQRF